MAVLIEVVPSNKNRRILVGFKKIMRPKDEDFKTVYGFVCTIQCNGLNECNFLARLGNKFYNLDESLSCLDSASFKTVRYSVWDNEL